MKPQVTSHAWTILLVGCCIVASGCSSAGMMPVYGIDNRYRQPIMLSSSGERTSSPAGDSYKGHWEPVADAGWRWVSDVDPTQEQYPYDASSRYASTPPYTSSFVPVIAPTYSRSYNPPPVRYFRNPIVNMPVVRRPISPIPVRVNIPSINVVKTRPNDPRR